MHNKRVNKLRYDLDVGDPKGDEIKHLKFEIWLGGRKRHADIQLYDLQIEEEVTIVNDELYLKQLVRLRNFLNSVPFLDEEMETR